ncbi:hypothetical protein TWF718_005336 [Orbilia javanica]|uniref:Uncharacterized protein n=1 Tax=Orbilia javanica TaxID=47235 RepID=A0AAN8N059_9PEZI
MYHLELEYTRFPWPQTRHQLANWPTTLALFRAADSLGIEELTVELGQQLTKALIHHSNFLPFKEAEDKKGSIDTSHSGICDYINQVYDYKGKVKMHGLIHLLLSIKDEEEREHFLGDLRYDADVNERFLRSMEEAAEEVELITREKCSCLVYDTAGTSSSESSEY